MQASSNVIVNYCSVWCATNDEKVACSRYSACGEQLDLRARAHANKLKCHSELLLSMVRHDVQDACSKDRAYREQLNLKAHVSKLKCHRDLLLSMVRLDVQVPRSRDRACKEQLYLNAHANQIMSW
jgi:hypothetical protein